MTRPILILAVLTLAVALAGCGLADQRKAQKAACFQHGMSFIAPDGTPPLCVRPDGTLVLSTMLMKRQ